MKKLLILFCLIITFICNFTQAGFAANARWENPGRIYTYVQPGCNNTELMKEAFAYWSRITNNKIVFKYVTNPSVAQINVRFVKDASKTSKMEHALGVTYPRIKRVCTASQCSLIFMHADIEIADNAPNGGLLRKESVYKVMIHEIGHAIGLIDHSDDPMSVMYPEKRSRNQVITKSDMQALSKLYGWKY